jgi:hypothetical protein
VIANIRFAQTVCMGETRGTFFFDHPLNPQCLRAVISSRTGCSIESDTIETRSSPLFSLNPVAGIGVGLRHGIRKTPDANGQKFTQLFSESPSLRGEFSIPYGMVVNPVHLRIPSRPSVRTSSMHSIRPLYFQCLEEYLTRTRNERA